MTKDMKDKVEFSAEPSRQEDVEANNDVPLESNSMNDEINAPTSKHTKRLQD